MSRVIKHGSRNSLEIEPFGSQLRDNSSASVGALGIVAPCEYTFQEFQTSDVDDCEDSALALEKEYIRGYLEGRKASEQQLVVAHEELFEASQFRISTMLLNLQKQLVQFLKRSEDTIFLLANALTDQIGKGELKVNRQTAIEQISEALRAVMCFGYIRIKIHPGDEKTVCSYHHALEKSSHVIRHIEIAVDANVAPGDFIIETCVRNVDDRPVR